MTKDDILKILNEAKLLNKSEKEIGVKYGFKYSSINHYKKKYKIYSLKKKRIITKELIEEIIEYSLKNKITEKKASKKYGISGLWYYKKKFGITTNPIGKAPFTARQQRIYNLNDDFFETPNILNCYYAGFFAADGNIYKNKLTLTLSTKEEKWLKQFIKDIKYEGEMRYGLYKQKFPYVSISFTSQKMISDLYANFNITPQKSLTLQPPRIEDIDLIKSFICGYIDGDGSINFCHNRKTQKRLIISLLGTNQMCEWIKQFIETKMNIPLAKLIHNKSHKGNTYSLCLSDKKARQLFLELYSLPVPKLERKWSKEKYKYCINFKKRLPICRRKGVNVFDINGNFVYHCDTLKEAEKRTGVHCSRISSLCKINDNYHMSNGYMFSRENKNYMCPFEASRST